jgi:hypothetical protein
VSAFQKVATFQIAGNQKQGGNVASYFCTPDGLVLHAIAGPVNEDVFLREARWTVETYNLALLDKHKTTVQLRTFFQKAHVERLKNEHGMHPNQIRVLTGSYGKSLTTLMEHQRHGGLGNQGKVHLLLALSPLPRLEAVYQIVFEKILNERVSTRPVVVAGK